MTGGRGGAPAVAARGGGRALGFLGVAVDADRNASVTGDVDISADGAAARTVVVTSREDLEIRRQVRELLTA